MRFISTDERPLSIETLQQALRETDPKYSIEPLFPGAGQESGKLYHGRAFYAVLEILDSSDGACEDLIGLRTEVQESGKPGASQVLDSLSGATALVIVEAKWQSRGTDKTLEKIDPLWDWLNSNRRGMVQCDGEGFYDGHEVVLDLSAKPR